MADIVLLDWDKVTWPFQDAAIPLVDVLVRRVRTGAVETVVIGGETVYHNGVFSRVDRDAVLGEIAAALGDGDTPAEAIQRRLASDLLAPVRDFYRGWL